jgi:hypothetical protein
MIKWLKERSLTEKLMLGLILVLLICIGFRWAWVKQEAGDAFRQRIEHFKSPGERVPPAGSLPRQQADTLPSDNPTL